MAHGRIDGIDPVGKTITLTHGAIPTLG